MAIARRGAIARGKRGARRVSPSLYKLLLTAHITVSVGWLGVALAKLVLGIAALTASTPSTAEALQLAMGVMDVTFTPLSIATLVSGVALSLTTKWGLLKHYWVVAKLALGVGVVMTVDQVTDSVVRQAVGVPRGLAGDGATFLGIGAVLLLLVVLALGHLLMLGAATVLSVYKPWGKTRFRF